MHKVLSCIVFSFLFFHATSIAMNRVMPDDEYNRALERNHQSRQYYHEWSSRVRTYFAINSQNNLIYYLDGQEQYRRAIVKKSFCPIEKGYYFTFANYETFLDVHTVIDHSIENEDNVIYHYNPCDCRLCTKPDNHCCTIS